jgi:hypothetical protein
MGIEISENDRHYADFLNTLLPPEEHILYKEQKKAAQAPAPKTVQADSPGRRPVPPRQSAPPPPPKGPPAAAQESGCEADDNEIDSLIVSLFSKRDNKQDE